MTVQAQQEREKTWQERLDEFLIDEFHYELCRVIIETQWRDVLIGSWKDPLDFFACLNTQHDAVRLIDNDLSSQHE